jgi:hypothetical protein
MAPSKYRQLYKIIFIICGGVQYKKAGRFGSLVFAPLLPYHHIVDNPHVECEAVEGQGQQPHIDIFVYAGLKRFMLLMDYIPAESQETALSGERGYHQKAGDKKDRPVLQGWHLVQGSSRGAQRGGI